MKKIISHINNILSEKTILSPKDSCLCGLSGGQDSILLFIILLHLTKQRNLNIQILNFHHFWQQKNFLCSQQVWKLAFVFGNPIYIIISESFLDNEKKAREWRQQGLERISSIENCKKILTGHTASDRIETGFWHLIRGTSPQGIISLKWQTNLLAKNQFFNFPLFINSQFFNIKNSFDSKTLYFGRISKNKSKKKYKKSNNRKQLLRTVDFRFSKKKKLSLNFNGLKDEELKLKQKKKISRFSFLIFNFYFLNTFFLEKKQKKTYTVLIFNFFFSKKNILRPLLIFHRTDITLFSKKYLLPIISDPSNEKLCWSRNRIRHQLFPLLRFFFNPNSEYVLNNFLETSLEEQNYFEYLVDKIFQYWLKEEAKCSNMQNQIQKLPTAIKKRLLLKIFQFYTKLQPNLLQLDLLKTTIQKN